MTDEMKAAGVATESDGILTKRPDETQTEFAVRCIRAETWKQGYRSGFSIAMRRMSDEPGAPTPRNPHVDYPPAPTTPTDAAGGEREGL